MQVKPENEEHRNQNEVLGPLPDKIGFPNQLDTNVTHASVMEGFLGEGNKLLQTQVIYKNPESSGLPFELLHYRIQLGESRVASVLLYEMSQMEPLNTRQDASKAFDQILVAANTVPHIFMNGNASAHARANMLKIAEDEDLYSIFNLSTSMSGVDFFSQVVWKMHSFPEEVTNRLKYTFIITNLPNSPRNFLVRLAMRVTRNTQVVANLPEALSLIKGMRY